MGTKLSLYPFLSEILSKLEAVASGMLQPVISRSYDANHIPIVIVGESNTKLTLFSGHDTVRLVRVSIYYPLL